MLEGSSLEILCIFGLRLHFISAVLNKCLIDGSSARQRFAHGSCLRSVFILFEILHVETIFGNEGERFLHACMYGSRGCSGGLSPLVEISLQFRGAESPLRF